MLAGPYCSYQLALMGADVVKVEAPPDGDLARLFGADPALSAQKMGTSFLAQNAGKRSIVLNLKNEADRETFRDLVRSADVLLENYRPGVMERLGLGYQALTALRPGLVYCAISGFGATGPLRNRPAYDQIIQGFSGAMDATGNSDSGPLRAGYPICDILGGLNGCFAIASALVRARLTGEGACLDVSLMDSTVSAMAWAVSNYLLAGRNPQRAGNDNTAASPSGSFRTADGMINIAANKQAQYEALCHAIGRSDLIQDARFAERRNRLIHRHVLKAEIEQTLASGTTADWDAVLTAAHVPCGPVLTVGEALAHPQMQEREIVQRFDDLPLPDGSATAVVRGGFLVDGVIPKVDRPPPALDADRAGVLEELDRKLMSRREAG